MLQPRILVGSHLTDQQATTKFNNCVAIKRQNCKTNSTMCAQNEHLTQATTANSDECGINIKRRQTTMHNKSTRHLSPALNIMSSSLHSLATFLILAITLYSTTTLCMAQLSGEFSLKNVFFIIFSLLFQFYVLFFFFSFLVLSFPCRKL